MGQKLLAYLAAITVLPGVLAYPSGAPPEGCRSMIPGHGVPPQTGTLNPYTVKTDRTTFSCPGDEIRVTVDGSEFRGFLCEPVPNTGNFVDGIGDTVPKQNKCGQMASVTHVDNRVKRGISFLWKPQTVQTIYISCTIVQSKFNFWVNITSPPLTFVKSDCNRRVVTEKEAPEQHEHAQPSDVTNVANNVHTGPDAIINSGTDGQKIDKDTTNATASVHDKGGKSKDAITRNQPEKGGNWPEKGGKSKDAITRNQPEKGGNSKDAITDRDTIDTADADRKGQGHTIKGLISLMVFMGISSMFVHML